MRPTEAGIYQCWNHLAQTALNFNVCSLEGENEMLSEFKDFIAKGNVMDLAVGVIIGGAFALITASLVGDVIMPFVGWIFGGLDFSNYFIALGDGVTATSLEAAKEQGAVLAYGSFITTIFNFIIIAFVIFMLVRYVNKIKAAAEEEEEAAPEAPAADIVLLTEIRDALKR
jgi:large conductance mechanosensitive channel